MRTVLLDALCPPTPPQAEPIVAVPLRWLALLPRYAEDMGALHDDDCPKDDTCDCSCRATNDAVNALCRIAADIVDAPSSQSPSAISPVVHEVIAERVRQDAKWGGPAHDWRGDDDEG
jgi:hypothetical protein